MRAFEKSVCATNNRRNQGALLDRRHGSDLSSDLYSQAYTRQVAPGNAAPSTSAPLTRGSAAAGLVIPRTAPSRGPHAEGTREPAMLTEHRV